MRAATCTPPTHLRDHVGREQWDDGKGAEVLIELSEGRRAKEHGGDALVAKAPRNGELRERGAGGATDVRVWTATRKPTCAAVQPREASANALRRSAAAMRGARSGAKASLASHCVARGATVNTRERSRCSVCI